MRGLALGLFLLGSSSCGRPLAKSDASSLMADLVVYGKVWTGDSARPWAQAVAARRDTIVVVGDSNAVAPMVGPATKVISSLRGMVTPGFMDGHLHFIDGGFQLASVDLRPANSPAEFVARLKAYALERKPGEWIVGGDWDHERWRGSPLPTRAWIDSVTPRNPVFLSRLDGHMALANSAALRAAHLDRGTRDIPGGVIVRDPTTGEPTGILKDEAMGAVYRVIPAPSDAQRDAALRRALAHAASKGVTGFANMSVDPADLHTYLRAKQAGALTARAALYFPLNTWHAVADTVAKLGRGDKWVWIGGVKGFVDGSLGSRTALFFDPYDDDSTTRGLLVTPEDSLRAWIGAADSVGLQIAVHAIGERANALILSIYDSISAAHHSRDPRFRVEHAQHLRPSDISRLARSGVIASMQPYHVIDDGRWAERRIGPTRIKTTYAFRSLLDQGGHLAFGSDWTVAPMDPILGIYAAVTRRTLDGKHPEGWVPEQKITVEEALPAYTAGNAYGIFAERSRGKLAPGYLADMVVLDQDLTAIPASAIEHVAVVATVVGGRIVFQQPQKTSADQD
jgi:predicted amidohydrolase YtcJ